MCWTNLTAHCNSLLHSMCIQRVAMRLTHVAFWSHGCLLRRPQKEDRRSRRKARHEKERSCPSVRGEPLLLKRYARMVPFIVNLGQGQPTRKYECRCAPLPDRSLPLQCTNPPMAYPDLRIAETA